MNRDDEIWSLNKNAGRLHSAALQAEIDLAHPQLGLRTMELAGQQHSGPRLRVGPRDSHDSWPAKLADAYVRGRDLVASYAPTDTWPYSPTIYWTADALESHSEILASLSLVVSIQTNLLDTHPRLDVRSELAADEVVMVTLVDDDLLVDSHGAGVQAIDPRASACGLICACPAARQATPS